jgi:hypothetical protein
VRANPRLKTQVIHFTDYKVDFRDKWQVVAGAKPVKM